MSGCGHWILGNCPECQKPTAPRDMHCATCCSKRCKEKTRYEPVPRGQTYRLEGWSDAVWKPAGWSFGGRVDPRYTRPTLEVNVRVLSVHIPPSELTVGFSDGKIVALQLCDGFDEQVDDGEIVRGTTLHITGARAYWADRNPWPELRVGNLKDTSETEVTIDESLALPPLEWWPQATESLPNNVLKHNNLLLCSISGLLAEFKDCQQERSKWLIPKSLARITDGIKADDRWVRAYGGDMLDTLREFKPGDPIHITCCRTVIRETEYKTQYHAVVAGASSEILRPTQHEDIGEFLLEL